jgi:hypothetical protein
MPRSESLSRSQYFVNVWIDAAMIGGISIVFFLSAHLFTDAGRTPALLESVAIASLFVNYPHFSATIYRLYQSPANIRQFPVTAIGVPVLIAAAVSASLWQPEVVAPYFVILFLIWSPFHYSGQTIGITMLYARRSGTEIGRWQRIALSTFVYSTFIVGFAYTKEPLQRYGVTIPIIHFPTWFDAVVIAVMIASVAGFLTFVILWSFVRRRLPPLMVLLPAATQFVWFLPGRQAAMFFEFVPFFHCLQYLYVAWAMQMGLRLGKPVAGSKPHKLLDESMRWAWRNYVGGLFLFIALPWIGFWINVPLITSAGIVLAAVNLHHFIVDGVIWKLRDTGETSPLMMNAADWSARRALVAT